jgi:hypothetical protein
VDGVDVHRGDLGFGLFLVSTYCVYYAICRTKSNKKI